MDRSRETPEMAYLSHGRVFCTDGYCGRSTYVVLSPSTEQISHLVVQDRDPPATERLVPMSLVGAVKDGVVQLSCDKATLAQLEPFLPAAFIRVELSQYDQQTQHDVLAPYTAWPVIGKQPAGWVQ